MADLREHSPQSMDGAAGPKPEAPKPQAVPQAHAGAPSFEALDLALDDVVVIFASDDWFVPYLSVALQSIKETANPRRTYDIVILSRNITVESAEALEAQMDSANIHLGFLDAEAALGDVDLPQHGHFSKETYYRLLAPELLYSARKALYLDCDIVAVADVAELFDTPLGDTLVAATRDADTAGQAEGYEPTVHDYLLDVVGIPNTSSYLQAGVVLMNLAEFRRRYPSQMLIDIASERHWQWLDQDVLNTVVRGDFIAVPMRWNMLVDWQGLRRKNIIGSAPADLRAAYEVARENPAIIHYAGPDDRPWQNPAGDFAAIWWEYAANSPFYAEILARYKKYHALNNLPKRAQVALVFKLLQPTYDVLFKPGSRRRKVTIEIFFRGLNFNLV